MPVCWCVCGAGGRRGRAVQPRSNGSALFQSGASGSWGERANRDLKFTRGKGFRHEKTKKKRGSYSGHTPYLRISLALF